MDECYICCDTLNDTDDIVELKCNHKFHINCILMSYKKAKNKLCPYCRQPGGTVIEKNIQNIQYCKAIISSGINKGCVCTNKAKYNNYCGKHKKYNLLSEN